jgi:hypothetical protein
MDNAAVPAAGKYDRAQAMQRVVDAQRAYDGATSNAAAAAADTRTAEEYWRRLNPSRT